MALKINDNGINRDMTDDEIANLKTISDEAKANARTVAAKQAARQAVLDKLGLTADEANALLG
jgi:hypothetical protein